MGPADGGSVHLSALLCPLQADRQYDVPPQHRLPKQPKDGFLVEQVFSPHPHPASLRAPGNNPLYTNMRRTELAEVKRGPPSWTVEDFARNTGDKGKLTALDLQVSLWWCGVWGVCVCGGEGTALGGCRRGLRWLSPACDLATELPGPAVQF